MRELQDDLLRLTRERDAERAKRELKRTRERLGRALAVIAVLRRREAQSRRAKD